MKITRRRKRCDEIKVGRLILAKRHGKEIRLALLSGSRSEVEVEVGFKWQE